MKNPNSPANRIKRGLLDRWSTEDYPGAEPRFQIKLLVQDIAIFVLLPVVAIVMFKSCENGSSASSTRRQQTKQIRQNTQIENSKSQIIDFSGARKGGVGVGNGTKYAGISKRAPGSLVRVKLLNVVETYSTAPVHAQIVDGGLGGSLVGGTLIGDANPDPAFEKISINFKFARHPNQDNVAVPISARALKLDGTLGLDATKKEGFFARSAYNSASGVAQEAQGRMNGAVDLKEILFRALTAGMVQEFGSGAQVERNRSQVLALAPSTEFFAELTDFFPGGSK